MGRKRVIPPNLEAVVFVMHDTLNYSSREIAKRLHYLGVRGEKGQPLGHHTVLNCIHRFAKLPEEKLIELTDAAKRQLLQSVQQKRQYMDEESYAE
jgi:transposase